ncbi:MAG TPA: ATP-binding protein [Phenylobacterium sp.]|nr:ATP-binding protein [Phenylobacterium sp.]
MTTVGPEHRIASPALGSPNTVVALAIAVALVVLAACAALFLYAEAAVDEVVQTRDARLMDRAVAEHLDKMKEDVTAEGVWTDAYEVIVHRFDPIWLHVNYGQNFYQVRKHRLTVIFDGQDRPLYTSLEGERVDPSRMADFIQAARPLLAAARAATQRKIAETPAAEGLDRQAAEAAAVRVGDRVYFAAASTIVPEPGYAKPLAPGPGPAVLSARNVDAEVLRAMGADYGLKAPRLVTGPKPPRAAIPLTDMDGRVVGAVAWTPEAPGLGFLLRARWQILVVGLAVGGAVFLLVMRLRRMTRGVAEARDRAEAGDRAKSEFIANMSHEIRTPLNGVLGMAQVMEGHELSAAQRERLKVIRESGATLLALLNDVLDLSKIEAGKLELGATTFDVEELAHRVCATFAGLAAAKDLELRTVVDPSARGAWIGDALRIRQVLSNLISNAVKFTDAGQVILSVARTAEGLEFCVTDTGIGVDEDRIPTLFDKFSQADASATRRYGGTGLGLAIVRALVQLMGGDIQVESRRGEGSRFVVSLPLVATGGARELAAAAPVEGRPMRPPQAIRILAAEDNAVNQLVLRALVEPLDAELTLVENGREAVEAFQTGAFDVILMDVQMPEMNGLDATRAIRALEAAEGRGRMPVVAMTANVMSHQLDDYLVAGMDGHIAKPVDIGALYKVLEQALNGELESQASAAA